MFKTVFKTERSTLNIYMKMKNGNCVCVVLIMRIILL